MKRHITIWICLASLLLISAPAAAELETRLPTDTLVYLEWSGRSLPFDGSMCGQAINDPGTQKLINSLKIFFQKSFAKAGPEAAKKAKPIMDNITIAVQHRVALAVTELSMEDKMLSAVLLIDLGKDKAVFQKNLDAILPTAPKDALPDNMITLGNTTYTLFSLPKKGMELAYGFIGKSNLFFVSFSTKQGLAKTVIQATAAKSLAGNKKFVGCMKEVGGENQQVAYYVDVAALKKRLQPAAPADTEAPKAANALDTVVSAATMLKILGVSKISALAGTVRIVDKGMYSKTRLFTPVPHQGLLMPFAGAPLTDADLAAVPADADFVLAGNVSPKALFAEFRRAFGQINPSYEKIFTCVLAAWDKKMGVSIETDLLAALGDTWVLSSAASQGGTLTGTILTLELADEAKAAAALAKIEKFIELQAGRGVSLETFKSGKTDIRYLRFAGRRPGPGMFVLPAWAIHKKRLYIALWPQVIASALENKTAPLTTAAAFKKTRRRVSANASGLFYVNTPEVLKKVYPLYLIGGTALSNAAGQQLARQFGIGAISFPLPDSLQGLIKYAMPDISSVSSDAKGITFEGYGSTPSIGVVPVAAATVAIAMPALQQAKDKAKQAVSANNLRQISIGIIVYTNDFQGKMPPNFDVLIENNYFPDCRLFKSPASKNPAPRWDPKNKKIVGLKDYIYVYYKGRFTDIPFLTKQVRRTRGTGRDGRSRGTSFPIQAYENPANYDNKGTYILRTDSSVSWVDMATFRKLLKKSLAASEKITPADKKPAGKPSAPVKASPKAPAK
ncbi:MAG: DUF3352 domain-containing protein [Phycisphaerae bacterium]|nr:DUF3352 domain-containing protein [Phycisphaerae bacterium]